jgi:hypothetical protein
MVYKMKTTNQENASVKNNPVTITVTKGRPSPEKFDHVLTGKKNSKEIRGIIEMALRGQLEPVTIGLPGLEAMVALVNDYDGMEGVNWIDETATPETAPAEATPETAPAEATPAEATPETAPAEATPAEATPETDIFAESVAKIVNESTAMGDSIPELLAKCLSKAQALNNLNAILKGIDALLVPVENDENEKSLALASILKVKASLPAETVQSVENALSLAQAATIVRKQKNTEAKKRVYDAVKQAIGRNKPAYLAKAETIGIKGGWFTQAKEAKKAAKPSPIASEESEAMASAVTVPSTIDESHHTQGEWDSINQRLDSALAQGRKDAETCRTVLAERDNYIARIADLEKEKNSALLAMDVISAENRRLQSRIADFERGQSLAMVV